LTDQTVNGYALARRDRPKAERFVSEFQALLEKYDVRGTRCTLYDGRDEACGDDCYIAVDGKVLRLHEMIQEDRLTDQ
jgi:hypothetical protein